MSNLALHLANKGEICMCLDYFLIQQSNPHFEHYARAEALEIGEKQKAPREEKQEHIRSTSNRSRQTSRRASESDLDKVGYDKSVGGKGVS